MKRYATKDLLPGMVVASPVFSSRGQLILEAGTVLTDTLISRMGFYGIYNAMIEDEPEDDIEDELMEDFIEDAEDSSDEAVTEDVTVEKSDEASVTAASHYLENSQSRYQKIKRKPEFQKFQVEYSKQVSSLENAFSRILTDTNQELDTTQLLGDVRELADSTKSSLDLFDMLHNMRQIDDSIYAHSLNVALIAKMLGKWLHYSDEDLKILTLCGLLHDIGKTALPLELLNKPGKYTEEEYKAVKQHPMLGYQLLKDQPLDERVKNAALMHHERCDGTGYPQGLKLEQVDDFAMLVAIADVYDAMTAARSYRKPLCPFQVIDAFEKEGLQKYNPKFILTFLEHIADTYQHNRVMLNTGQSGTVVMINKHHLTKPYIQLSDDSILDMTQRMDLEIVSIL